jgi:hypothetical protein
VGLGLGFAQDIEMASCNSEEPVYVSLGDIGSYEELASSSIVDGTNSVTVTFENGAGQQFSLEVHAHDEATIRDFLAELNICFEAVPAPAPVADYSLEEENTVVSSEAYMLNQILEMTGLDQAELYQLYLEQENPDISPQAFYEVLVGNYGFDLESFYQNIEANLGMASDDSYFTTEGTLIVFDPVLQPIDGGGYYQLFRDYPETILVSFAWTNVDEFVSSNSEQESESLEEVYWVEYAIDPTINRSVYHYYKAQCSNNSSVSIRASAGSATVSFWRYSPYAWLGSRTADINGIVSPSALSESRTSNASYDSNVKGERDNSSYSISGRYPWTQGSGGGCG